MRVRENDENEEDDRLEDYGNSNNLVVVAYLQTQADARRVLAREAVTFADEAASSALLAAAVSALTRDVEKEWKAADKASARAAERTASNDSNGTQKHSKQSVTAQAVTEGVTWADRASPIALGLRAAGRSVGEQVRGRIGPKDENRRFSGPPTQPVANQK